MTRRELNELTQDKDGDGIPDRIDSTFNPPEKELHYALVMPSVCDYLERRHFSFSKCKKAAEDGKVAISFAQDDLEKYQQLMNDLMELQRKGGRGK